MAPIRRIAFTPRAEEDVNEIAAYSLSRWGAGQAKEYVRELLGAIDGLRRTPELGALYPQIPVMRRLPVREYAVFYRLIEDEAQIVRILHQRRDAAAHLR